MASKLKPMNTAPKDGTPIFVYGGHCDDTDATNDNQCACVVWRPGALGDAFYLTTHASLYVIVENASGWLPSPDIDGYEIEDSNVVPFKIKY